MWSRMCLLAFAAGVVVSCGPSVSMTVKGH